MHGPRPGHGGNCPGKQQRNPTEGRRTSMPLGLGPPVDRDGGEGRRDRGVALQAGRDRHGGRLGVVDEAVDVVGAAAQLEQAGGLRAGGVAGRHLGRQIGGRPLLHVAAHVEQLEARGWSRSPRRSCRRRPSRWAPASCSSPSRSRCRCSRRPRSWRRTGRSSCASPRRRPASRWRCRGASWGRAARRPSRPRPSSRWSRASCRGRCSRGGSSRTRRSSRWRRSGSPRRRTS